MTKPTLQRLSVIIAATLLSLSGCSAVKNIANKKDPLVMRAEKSDSQYYQEAEQAIQKGHYKQAALALQNLHTFYPSGRYAQQALLDLIYVHYQAGDYEAATNISNQFIRSYPTSSHLDYALYAQGVTYMQGSPKASRLIPLNQNERDTAYLRLAFQDFQTLTTRFPNSVYAPDAAQRMLAIYNDFAEHELQAARWYIKREAYVAAANRAKWVFQYYPQSQAIPEAIAILAYSNDKLGLAQTAEKYKTLLTINYPSLIDGGQVILPNNKTGGLLGFVGLGRSQQKDFTAQAGDYQKPTRPQVIKTPTSPLPQDSNQIVLPPIRR